MTLNRKGLKDTYQKKEIETEEEKKRVASVVTIQKTERETEKKVTGKDWSPKEIAIPRSNH